VAEEQNSEVLVSCKGISKKFCRNLKKSLLYGVKDGISEILTGQSSDALRKDEFWALKDVSFEIRRGECLGLLGRNGAGKTTLLKVLSGLIKPDQGTVSLKGRVGGLIALGAGFNGILSGRENIRINGSILGYSRDLIEEKMQEIIDFAEIPDFIDAPVNTYSSGMSVRLGFAIAAILTKPDILLLDEVLAVGDIGFTIKCLNAVREMMEDSAVIFVSHNMQFISQFCTQVMLFKKGKVISEKKNVANGISEYLCFFQNNYINTTSESVEFKNFKLSNNNGSEILYDSKSNIWQINQGDQISLSFDFVFNKGSKMGVDLFTYIIDLKSNPVICFNKFSINNKGGNILSLKLDLGVFDLNSGRYSFTIGAVDLIKGNSIVRMEGVLPFFIVGQSFDWGYINRNAELTIN
jgi:lipopolysaccharide transport system ATP-binding protein